MADDKHQVPGEIRISRRLSYNLGPTRYADTGIPESEHPLYALNV